MVDLIGMGVIRQRERCIVHEDLVLDFSTKPVMLEELLNDRVLALARTAEIVKEEVDGNASFTGTNRVSWVSSVDRRGI